MNYSEQDYALSSQLDKIAVISERLLTSSVSVYTDNGAVLSNPDQGVVIKNNQFATINTSQVNGGRQIFVTGEFGRNDVGRVLEWYRNGKQKGYAPILSSDNTSEAKFDPTTIVEGWGADDATDAIPLAGDVLKIYEGVAQNAHIRVNIDQIETSDGVYDWDAAMESTHGNILLEEGANVELRIIADEPNVDGVGGDAWNIPNFYKASPYNITGTAYSGSGISGWSPDYTDINFKAKVQALLTSCANYFSKASIEARGYHETPTIKIHQVGIVGFWGEMHTYVDDTLIAGDIIKDYIQMYIDTFTEDGTRISLRRNYMPDLFPDVCYHMDMYGETTDTGYFAHWQEFLNQMEGYTDEQGVAHQARTDWMESGPISGEASPNSYTSFLSDTYVDDTIDMVKQLYASKMAYYSDIENSVYSGTNTNENSELLQRTLGYRLMIQNVALDIENDSIALAFKIENKGSAKRYEKDVFNIVILDDSNEIVERIPTDIDITEIGPNSRKSYSMIIDYDNAVNVGLEITGINQPLAMLSGTNIVKIS